jgi:hypothetical protein
MAPHDRQGRRRPGHGGGPGPANPDIIDHLFDATEGVDALRTVEYDEEEDR